MLYDPLQKFDYELIHGQKLVAIKGSKFQRLTDGTISYEQVIFIFDNCSLLVFVNDDTDEIILEKLGYNEIVMNNASSVWEDIEAFGEYLGRDLGWCWIGRNYRGYADAFILSFDTVDPHIMLYGMASNLHLYKLVQVC